MQRILLIFFLFVSLYSSDRWYDGLPQHLSDGSSDTALWFDGTPAANGWEPQGAASEFAAEIDSISPLKVKPTYTLKYYFTNQPDSSGNEILAINLVCLPITKFSGGEGWATIYGAPRGTYNAPRFGTFSGVDTTWIDTAATPVKNYVTDTIITVVK